MSTSSWSLHQTCGLFTRARFVPFSPCFQERAPLLPAAPQLDAGLLEQVQAALDAAIADGAAPDVLKAQADVACRNISRCYVMKLTGVSSSTYINITISLIMTVLKPLDTGCPDLK